MAYPYPSLVDVQAEYPTLIQVIQKRDVPLPKAIKATWVVGSFGLSVYPGEPGTPPLFGGKFEKIASGTYGDLEAIADLELLGDAAPEEGLSAAALPAIPWQLLLPYLAALLQQLISRFFTQPA